jgi:hypothetical protein
MQTLKCKSCGKELEFADNQAGMQFECPYCRVTQVLAQTPQGLSMSGIPVITSSESTDEQPYLFGPAIPEPRAYRFFGYLVLFLAIAIALAAVIAGTALILTRDSGTLEDALGLNLIFIGVCLVFVGIFVLLVCKWLAAIQTYSQKMLDQVRKISALLEKRGGDAEKRR